MSTLVALSAAGAETTTAATRRSSSLVFTRDVPPRRRAQSRLFPFRIQKNVVGDVVYLPGGYFAPFVFKAECLVQFHCGAIGGKNFQLYALKRPSECLLDCHRKELAANTSGPMTLLHTHTKTPCMPHALKRVRDDIAPTNDLSCSNSDDVDTTGGLGRGDECAGTLYGEPDCPCQVPSLPRDTIDQGGNALGVGVSRVSDFHGCSA